MTDQELRDIVARIGISLEESDRRLKFALEESKRETDQALQQLSKQMGELGNRLGGFTEGLAWPSLDKLFREQFGMNDVAPRRRASQNDRTLEVNVLAYDNTGTRNEVFIAEIKSRLKPEAIAQLLKTIVDFPHFFPDLKGRKIYGLIAAVDIPENLGKEVLQRGLYLARISDETFTLQVPRGFKPKAFGPAANGNSHKKNGAKKRATK